MYYAIYKSNEENSLEHHGVLGMKWGIRRYQSYDTVPRGSGEGGKEIGLAKKSKNLYDRNYHVEYTKFGNTRVVDDNNKKIKGGTKRKIEREMKKDYRKNDREKYHEYKQAKRAANTSFSYIGNSSTMALMTMGLNAATATTRSIGKETVDKMLADYANLKFSEISNGKLPKKEGQSK